MLLRSPDENADAETEKSIATSDEEQEAKESEKAHITLSSNSEDNNSWEYNIIDESVAKFVSTSTTILLTSTRVSILSLPEKTSSS